MDILLAYRAAQSPGSIYDVIHRQQQLQDQANFECAEEYQDFKEFLFDEYMGHEKFKECYLKFMRWQGYSESEIKELCSHLLED